MRAPQPQAAEGEEQGEAKEGAENKEKKDKMLFLLQQSSHFKSAVIWYTFSSFLGSSSSSFA